MPGWRCVSTATTGDLLELALLEIISGGSGGGGGSGNVYVQNFGGVSPAGVVFPTGNATAFDTSTLGVWAYNGSTWTQFIA